MEKNNSTRGGGWAGNHTDETWTSEIKDKTIIDYTK